MSNKQVVLSSYVGKSNHPQLSNFAVQDVPKPTEADLKEGDVLLQTLYLSVDPYMRMRMNPEGSYVKAFEINSPGVGSGVGKVVASKNPNHHVGDTFTSQKDLSWPWRQFVVFDAKTIENYHKLRPDFPKEFLSATIGWLGMPGLTAYFGLLERGKPKEGETVVISGAAGACGSVAGQIAKIKKTRVIGIVGSKDKEDYIKSLGFDGAIIYKDKSKEQLIEELKKLAPNGADIYYDNVGGEISNAVICVMNENGRVPICGQISNYNKSGLSDALSDEAAKIVEEKKIQRGWFMYSQFQEKFNDGWSQLVSWAKEGKLRCQETTYNGIEQLPNAFIGLFAGDNIGKAVIKVSE